MSTTNTLRKYGYDKYEQFIMRTSKIVEEENPSLHQFLLTHEQLSIKDSIPSNHPLHDYFDRTTGLLSRAISVAKEEWSTVHENGVPKIIEDTTGNYQCKLCGHKQLKYIFFIYHPERNIEIEVGSECIRAFDIAINGTFGEVRDKILDASRKLFKLVGKDAEIEKFTSQGISRFRLAKVRLSSKPYYPPNPHFARIINTEVSINELLRIFKNDIRQATPEKIQHYNSLLSLFEEDIETVDRLVKENSDYTLISQDVIQWVLKQKSNKKFIMARLCSRGYISQDNVHLIEERKHLKTCISEIKKRFTLDECSFQADISQSSSVLVELKNNRGEFVFKIHSSEIILEAAKNGFPDKISSLRMEVKNLLMRKNAGFLPEKDDGERAINVLFSKAGYNVLENNFSVNKSLVQRGNMGSIINIGEYIPVIGRAILSDDDRIATAFISKSMIKLVNLKDAKSDWHDLYA